VTWTAVAGATGYHVYRDGVRVTTSPVTGTSYNDAGAPAGGVPTQVQGVSATSQTDGVRLTWNAAGSSTGERASYQVRTVSGAQQSALSLAASGFRAGQAVTGYEAQAGSGSWVSVGNWTFWTHVDAPLGSVSVGTPTATTTLTTGVNLSVAAASTTAGPFLEYRVRAVNGAGAGAPSAPVNGNRSVGTPSYQWQWSTSSGGSYTNLSGATGTTASDTTISAGATRWYRVAVSAAGASSGTSSVVQGQRATSGGGTGSLGAACTADSGCPSGAWCPTDTSEHRCSPRPSVDGVQMPFQWVPRGTFTMGSPSGEVGRTASREAQVEVTLTRDTFVQRTEVTQGQWAAVMGAWNALPAAQRTMSGWTGATPVFGTDPSYFGAAGVSTCTLSTCPVERVSWWDAVVFANALSILEGLEACYTLSGCGTGTGQLAVGGGCSGTNTSCSSGGNFSCSGVTFVGKACTGYRLPTEAEWERAARGGTTTATYNGNLSGTDCAGSQGVLNPIAWYTCNSGSRTQAVGGKTGNGWGLYDMLGNVREWTWTWYAQAQSGGTDPLGPSTGSYRVHRGGSWGNSASIVRSAGRYSSPPGGRDRSLGFRLARSAP
jgi:formylglycine-generating enzyme required for sulfatase activity